MRRLLVILVRGYQKLEAPWRSFPLCGCRPCCSKFAIRCLTKYPLLRALALIRRRAGRCGYAVHHLPVSHFHPTHPIP